MSSVRLLVNIEANSAKLISEVAKSRKSIEGMKGSVDSMRSSLSLIKIDSIVNLGRQAINTAQQIYSFAKSISSSLNDIERQASVLGISTTELQKWQYAAKMSDVEAESLAMGFKFLSRNMSDTAQGTGEAKTAFEAMGISVKGVSGGLKPLDVMMKEIMDKFAGWADGPQKIAIALALFGRSGQTLIPLLNKGATGFEEFAREAAKLGIILDPTIIAAGSKAEDSFKKLEAQINATKLSLAPVALEFTKFFNDILWGAQQTAGIYTKYVYPWLEDWGARIKRLGEIWMEFGESVGIVKAPIINIPLLGPEAARPWREKPITPAPALPGKYAGAETKDVLAAWEAIIKTNEDLWGIYQGQNETIYLSLDTIKEMDIKMAMLWESANKSNESWEDSVSNLQKGSVVIDGMIYRYDILVERLNAEKKAQETITEELYKQSDYYQYEENMLKARYRTAELEKKRVEDIQAVFTDVGRVITESWVSNFRSMLDGTISFADGVKNVFKDLANQIISSITRMIANWILWNNVQGAAGYKAGATGWQGILGSVAGWILAEGGITGPLLSHYPVHTYQEGGIASTPQLGIFGEGGGEEAFVPLQHGKIPVEGGEKATNNITAFYIYANDPISFRDFIRRNPEAIIEVMHKSSREAGVMRGIIKNVG